MTNKKLTKFCRHPSSDLPEPEGGDRLLGRCVRHATCSHSDKVKEKTCHVIKFDNQPCLLVHQRMRASMKQNVYNTSICFNENTIIACLCDCKSGCEGNGRIVCVHTLPIMYQITLLLSDELAHDILVEYSNQWRTLHDTDFIKENKDEIKRTVLLLMSACQHYDKNDDKLKLDVLLDNFLVGTSKGQHQRLPADYSQLRSLRMTDLSSCNKIAENIIQHRNNIVSEEEEEEVQPITYDTYADIIKTIAAFKKCCPCEKISFLKKMVGYKLLKLRSFPLSVSRPGRISGQCKHVRELIALANQNDRNKQSYHATTHDDSSDNNETTTNNNNFERREQYKEQTRQLVTTNTQKKKRSRISCCICPTSTTTNPNAIFHRIPILSTQAAIRRHDTDDIRRTYYKRIHHRKLVLKILGLMKSDPRTGLRYCDRHPQEIVQRKFTWFNEYSEKMIGQDDFILPVDNNGSPNRIRRALPPKQRKTSTSHVDNNNNNIIILI
jgi:hypothetical protein